MNRKVDSVHIDSQARNGKTKQSKSDSAIVSIWKKGWTLDRLSVNLIIPSKQMCEDYIKDNR